MIRLDVPWAGVIPGLKPYIYVDDAGNTVDNLDSEVKPTRLSSGTSETKTRNERRRR